MESTVVYMKPEQGEKMMRVWRSVIAKVILAACFGLTVMVIEGAPFFYEVPVLILAYMLFSTGLTHCPLKRLPKRMLIRPELTARMAELPKELILLGVVLLFMLPTATFVASGCKTAPFFLNVLVGILFLLKLRLDLEQYELSRIIPPPADHCLRIYGILRRLELVPAYCLGCAGHAESRTCCKKMFAETPDNLIRLAVDIYRGDGYWDKLPEKVPPGEVEGRREFVQDVLGRDPQFNAFVAADIKWHAQPTTKTELRTLLKRELETPYYFTLN